MEKTSECRNNDKCVNCKISLRKTSGKLKRIITNEDLNRYQPYCKNTLHIGSVFCHKHYIRLYQSDSI